MDSPDIHHARHPPVRYFRTQRLKQNASKRRGRGRDQGECLPRLTNWIVAVQLLPFQPDTGSGRQMKDGYDQMIILCNEYKILIIVHTVLGRTFERRTEVRT